MRGKVALLPSRYLRLRTWASTIKLLQQRIACIPRISVVSIPRISAPAVFPASSVCEAGCGYSCASIITLKLYELQRQRCRAGQARAGHGNKMGMAQGHHENGTGMGWDVMGGDGVAWHSIDQTSTVNSCTSRWRCGAMVLHCAQGSM